VPNELNLHQGRGRRPEVSEDQRVSRMRLPGAQTERVKLDTLYLICQRKLGHVLHGIVTVAAPTTADVNCDRLVFVEYASMERAAEISSEPPSADADRHDAPGALQNSEALYVTQYIYTYSLNGDQSLVVNTLTGAVDFLEKRLANLLKPRSRCGASAFSPGEIAFLVNRGYLLTHDRQQQEVAEWFAGFKRAMRSFHFIVCPTLTCNLRCHYCYEPLENRQSRKSMSPAHVAGMFGAMDRLISERQANNVHLEFFGGEPFLRSNREVVEPIIQEAASRDWSISGITNGTQLNAYFPIFRRFLPQISQLQITLDGPQRLHDSIRVNSQGRGSYREICGNVTEALKLGIPMVLRVNVGSDTVEHLPALFSDFETSGWTSYEYFQCQLAPVNDHGCTGCVANYQPEFKLLRQLHERFDNWEQTRDLYHVTLGYDMERRTSLLRSALYDKQSPLVRSRDLSGCSASNQHYVVFGADGFIYACPETVGITDTAIGKFLPTFQIDFGKWSKWDVNISNTAKCRDCSIAPICGGACPWHGFNSSSFDAYEPHCNYAHQTITTYLDLNKARLFELLN